MFCTKKSFVYNNYRNIELSTNTALTIFIVGFTVFEIYLSTNLHLQSKPLKNVEKLNYRCQFLLYETTFLDPIPRPGGKEEELPRPMRQWGWLASGCNSRWCRLLLKFKLACPLHGVGASGIA